MPAHFIATEGPYRGLVFNLKEGEEWVIGRDPDEAFFVLEDSTVSRKHARLQRLPEGIYLENLSKVSPTLVNGEQIEGLVLLKEGDTIQIGKTAFLFSEEDIPEIVKRPEKRGGYDDIFGSLDETPEELEAFEQGREAEKLEEEEERKEKEAPHADANAYDTIFEDVGIGDESEPFNLLSESPLLLKVISGPNAGAEIDLEKDRVYTIGKDPASCDIVFQDLSVSRNHARLYVNGEGQVEIEDLGSTNGTIVNGSPITQKTPISTQDLVSLGTTIFFIIDREASHETIYSPAIPVNEPPVIEEAKAEEAEENAPPVVQEEKKDWKKEPIPTRHLVMASSIAAIFLIVFLTFFSLFKAKPIAIAQKKPTEQIEHALAKFEGVQFSFNPASGKLFLIGHVLTGVDAQELKYRIDELEFVSAVENNVIIDETINKAMNDILNPNFKGVTIQTMQAGKFLAMGYVETNEQAGQLAEYLALNFPYLDRLENRVVVGQNIEAQIQGLLQSKGFGAVAFQYANGEIIFSGNYNDKMRSAYQELVHQVGQITGIHSVKDYAVAVTPNQAAIDLSQQFQVTGMSQHEGNGFAVVLNGKIYTLGDAINGMRITEIESSTILLEKEGIKYKINFTR